MANEAQNSPFIKQLASSDKEIRDKALDSLRTYLTSQSSIPELDLLKLWKGLFYCLWMQDKPILQQRLARELAALVDVLKPSLVLPFLDAYWKTMARDWSGIEALRMDKFQYLVRQYVNISFRYLHKGEWKNKDAIVAYAQILKQGPLEPMNVKIPNGLRYHILDVYVDELEKVAGSEKWDDQEALEMLLSPVTTLAKESPTKSVRKAAREMLDDDRVKAWRGEETTKDGEEENDEEISEGSDEEWGGIED